jgi:hypothetical protein
LARLPIREQNHERILAISEVRGLFENNAPLSLKPGIEQNPAVDHSRLNPFFEHSNAFARGVRKSFSDSY